MNRKTALIVASLAAVVGAIWYYHKRSTEIAQSQQNPNASLNTSLGAQAAAYDRNTGQTGDTYTSNDRYGQYLDYLKAGGQDSGKTFDQYLTASQAQSLPMNS